MFDFVTKEDESLSDLPVFSVSLKVFCCAVMSNNLYSHLKSETGWQQYTCEWGIHNLAFISIPRKYNMRDKGILKYQILLITKLFDVSVFEHNRKFDIATKSRESQICVAEANVVMATPKAITEEILD